MENFVEVAQKGRFKLGKESIDADSLSSKNTLVAFRRNRAVDIPHHIVKIPMWIDADILVLLI